MSNDPKIDEREQRMKERRIANMEADYLPTYGQGVSVTNEMRMANAAEYAAYQLGQINRRMGRLIELLEQAEARKD